MFTFQELHERLQKFCGYSSTEDIQFGKDLINEAEKYLAGLRNWEWTEGEFTFTTTAAQSVVKFPADYRKLISFKVTVGTIDYVPMPVYDPVAWDKMQATSAGITSDWPTHYHIRGNRLEVYPAMNSGNTGTLLYQKRPLDMLDNDVTTGTVTATLSSSTITGSGTSFASPADVGKFLQVTQSTGDKKWYKIASVASTTSLTLDIPYEGTTVAGGTYRIAPLPMLPEDYQDLLWMYPLSRWYILKSDEQRAQTYVKECARLIIEMERRYANKVYSNVSDTFGNEKIPNPNYNPWTITIT
jgi:hypothetical protein